MGPAIAVYCGSSVGRQQAYVNAALSLGRAISKNDYPLVYGGGTSGLMGIVSNAVLEAGGDVTGVIPYAIHAEGGERDQVLNTAAEFTKRGEVLVHSMHERKIEMAKRSLAFVGLPGGFGTFEEILEVATWTQLGIHEKPVVLLNVLSYFDPLKQLIDRGVEQGFINPANKNIIVFIDGPRDHMEHDYFDWGSAAIEALRTWGKAHSIGPLYHWGVQ